MEERIYILTRRLNFERNLYKIYIYSIHTNTIKENKTNIASAKPLLEANSYKRNKQTNKKGAKNACKKLEIHNCPHPLSLPLNQIFPPSL